jgi:hypothetical protein
MPAMRGAVRRSGAAPRGTRTGPGTDASPGFRSTRRAVGHGFHGGPAQSGQRTLGPAQAIALHRGRA